MSTPTASIGTVALRVEDLEEAADFYSSVVGLRPMARDGEGATLGAGGDALVRLLEAPEAEPRSLTQAGLYHLAIRVPTRVDLAEVLTRVRRAWRLEGASDHRVSESLYLSDPEGNGVEVYRDRPRREWPERGDGTVEMASDPLDIRELAGNRPKDPSDRVPPGSDMGHVHLEAVDLGVARDFFTDGLGMGVRQTYGDGAVFLAFDDYHHDVAVNAWNTRSEPAGEGRGLAWFEVRLGDEEAVAEAAARLREQGAKVRGASGGVVVEAPDGIRIRLVGS